MMDIRLKDNDVYISDSGCTEYIKGLDEAVQRVLLALSTDKGAFIYNRELGADYGGLSAGDAMIKEKLSMRFKEAAAGITEAEVRALSFDRINKTATAEIKYNGVCLTAEVDLSGSL